jgi:hypothetical protein
VIFDNLHMMHDIISDILTADTIPHRLKGEVINRQLDKLQDPSRDVMSMDEWRKMADHMGGVDAMGGVAAELVQAVRAPVTSNTSDNAENVHDVGPKPDSGAAPTPDDPQEPEPGDSVSHQH